MNGTYRKGSLLHDDSEVTRVVDATPRTFGFGVYTSNYITVGSTNDICKEGIWIMETLYRLLTIK
jgi:hypothetical protein